MRDFRHGRDDSRFDGLLAHRVESLSCRAREEAVRNAVGRRETAHA